MLAAAGHLGTVQPWMVLVLAFVLRLRQRVRPAGAPVVRDRDGRPRGPRRTASRSTRRRSTPRAWSGPAMAGVLLATVGEQGCFWLNALSYVAVLGEPARAWGCRRARSSGVARRWARGWRRGCATRGRRVPLRQLLLLLLRHRRASGSSTSCCCRCTRATSCSGRAGLRPAAHGLRRRALLGGVAHDPAAGPLGAAPQPAAGLAPAGSGSRRSRGRAAPALAGRGRAGRDSGSSCTSRARTRSCSSPPRTASAGA